VVEGAAWFAPSPCGLSLSERPPALPGLPSGALIVLHDLYKALLFDRHGFQVNPEKVRGYYVRVSGRGFELFGVLCVGYLVFGHFSVSFLGLVLGGSDKTFALPRSPGLRVSVSVSFPRQPCGLVHKCGIEDAEKGAFQRFSRGIAPETGQQPRKFAGGRFAYSRNQAAY
jgi:hypothetical protein